LASAPLKFASLPCSFARYGSALKVAPSDEPGKFEQPAIANAEAPSIRKVTVLIPLSVFDLEHAAARP
jgi:hypothetical protein